MKQGCMKKLGLSIAILSLLSLLPYKSFAEQKVLGVPWESQNKDTFLLCLEGDMEVGNEPWDAPHIGKNAHGANYCGRASIAMVANYFHQLHGTGRTLSQDRISYRLNGEVLSTIGFPPDYAFKHGFTGAEALDWALNESYHSCSDISFSEIKFYIDAGRPIIVVWSGHYRVIDGYRDDSRGKFVHLLDPGPLIEPVDKWELYRNIGNTGKFGCLVAPSKAPNVRGDGPEVWMDSDGDGIRDFDEIYRFGTDPLNADSDGDGVNDKEDMREYLFDNAGLYGPPAFLQNMASELAAAFPARTADGQVAVLACLSTDYPINPFTYLNISTGQPNPPPNDWVPNWPLINKIIERADLDGDGLRKELDPDNDGDGLLDGEEDTNYNGIYEPWLGETDNFNPIIIGSPGIFESSGPEGGPFTPSARIYRLTNRGSALVDWAADKGQSWVTLSPNSGLLAPGQSVDLVLEINSYANRLSDGDHYDEIIFKNLTHNREERRQVKLLVTNPGELAVTPDTGLTSSGPQWGPFIPASKTYTLKNIGGSPLSLSISNTASWVGRSKYYVGTLEPGSSCEVTVYINTIANFLEPGLHNDTVAFTNTINGWGNTTRPVDLTVASVPGSLYVYPPDGFSSSGDEGTIFEPSLKWYSLTNTGGEMLKWKVTSTASWLGISATSGSLASGTSYQIRVWINDAAKSLPPGTYSDTLNFFKTMVGTAELLTTRPVILTVNPKGALSVTPKEMFFSTGNQGGPFSPSTKEYTIENKGLVPINWKAESTYTWVSLSPTEGTLEAGQSSSILFSINSTANGLPSGFHNSLIRLINETNHDGDTTRSVYITVNEIDECPNDSNKTKPGICGCGIGDDDSDGDGIADCIDNCPSSFNPSQADSDSDGVGDACDNKPPVANAGPDQTVTGDSRVGGAQVNLDGSASSDPDGDSLSYEWVWDGGSAIGKSPIIMLPFGLTTVTLKVSDGRSTATDEVDINITESTITAITLLVPSSNHVLQGPVKLTAAAPDMSKIKRLDFYVSEQDGTLRNPIWEESFTGTFNENAGDWEYQLDTTLLPDGFYIVAARAIDSSGKDSWSDITQFSIRNWAILGLLPSSQSNKAGRSIPIKFALRIAANVDPAERFVWDEDLEIRIYEVLNPGTILQRSVYGTSSKYYRIDSIAEEYITNFKTGKNPARYVVEISRINTNWTVGTFNFMTVK